MLISSIFSVDIFWGKRKRGKLAVSFPLAYMTFFIMLTLVLLVAFFFLLRSREHYFFRKSKVNNRIARMSKDMARKSITLKKGKREKIDPFLLTAT
jgi:hypothetical protein